MKIDHIAVYVCDLEREKAFFTRFFGAKAGGKYHNQATGLQTYFLTFAGGARLELMYRPDLALQGSGRSQTGYAHLAVSVGSKREVDRLTNVLQEAGYAVASPPRLTGDGYYESCVLDPEGNPIEITV